MADVKPFEMKYNDEAAMSMHATCVTDPLENRHAQVIVFIDKYRKSEILLQHYSIKSTM
jgi:hypothetical protein